MLSAVAARKAAKAAQASTNASSKPSSPPPSTPSPSQPTSISKSLQEPTSRRKSASAAPSKNKRVKVAHTPANPDRKARYFGPGNGTSNARNGAIDTLDDSVCRIEVSSESDSSGEEMEIELPPIGPSSVLVTKNKRAWSPSRPMPDSSDDDDDDEPGPPGPAGYLNHSTSMKAEPVPLSTFRPVPNHNIYPATENEYASGERARILVFQPNEKLALVGTFSFCVLQGSLSLLGVTLSPSNTKHTVFAPRSSPVPILSWAKLDRQGSCIFPIPPSVRQQENTTAILIEDADTGIEGLGRICKVFENIFKPPREPDAFPNVDLSRIHIVRVRQPPNCAVSPTRFFKG